MKLLLKALSFDKELVTHIKQVRVNEAYLYFELISGRITMKEYLNAL